MKLYYAPGSCGLASQIALQEAGQKYELVKVDFKTKTTIEGDYRKVTPKGFIPVLKLDDGDMITEGAVILQWIADKNPASKLLPAFGTRERYTALEWLNFIASDLHKGMGVMFSSFIDPDTKKRFADGNLTSKFEYIDEHLSTNDHVLGAQFSVADAYLYNVLSWSPRVNLDLSIYKSIQQYMARMEQRLSIRAALEAERQAAATQ
ncbi:glutathione transferase GstA [Caballeronia sp. LZ035]|uniref:glutathione transferase GstA n=1 Tax=Caballeronia sp. LZ035 TaxID=3038568 RepID=UPI002854B5D5|nr:glutathione transferase GstA [Caballeronia sp. LZ035]MDR5758983.1 glutathione transferase GstA [Caballeronia sp. LZ035]